MRTVCQFTILLLFIARATTANCQTPLSPTGGDAIAPPHVIDTSLVQVPEPSAKALEYHSGNTMLWIVDTLIGFAIPALFLFTGFGARLRTWAARVGRKRFFTMLLFVAAFIGLSSLITLPLDYYRDFVRQHAYGLSDQEFGKWIGDWMKMLVIAIIGLGLFVTIPYALFRKSPRRWWIWTGLAATPIVFLIVMITPVWIEPLFNDFGPMQDKGLETKVLALAHRAGIDGANVYEVNKSVDTKTLNAYVTGLGATKRIVLWDTIIKKLDDQELLFVMGHEMGHYVLSHVLIGLGASVVSIFLLLFAIHRSAGSLVRRFGARFGFTDLADIASLPLVMLLLNVYGFILSPLVNAGSRYYEHEADRFGLELTRDNHSAATAFVKLQTEDLAVPRPEWWLVLLRADHPTLADRIEFANTYHPWRDGHELRYGDRIH